MSHSIEYYQRMSTSQLAYEMHHATYSMDRQRAADVYAERIAAQSASENARNNLQVAAMNARINDLQTRIGNLTHHNASMASIIQQQSDDLRNMQVTHAQQVETMRNDYNRRIEQVSRENAAALQDLDTRMVNNINELNATITNNFQRTSQMITAVNDTLTNRINTVHADLSNQLASHQTQIANLESKFTALAHSEAELRQNAQEYLEAAIEVINATIEYNNSNSHNWRRDDLNELITQRSGVQDDLNSGMLAAGVARSNARRLFNEALRYRANVHADELEWQLLHAAAQQSVDAVGNDLEIGRTIDADGFEIDVNYWTCGDLSRIETQLNELQTLLENPNLSRHDLEAISQLAETYRQEINTAVTFAMQAIQCSYDRKDLMEIAIENIRQRTGDTLRPVWQEYFAGDDRLGYRVYLTAPSGERVVLTAEPSKDDAGICNQFRFEVLSHGHRVHNAEEASIFTHAITDALSQIEECQFTSPNCTNTAAPVADCHQGDNFIWSKPADTVQESARQNATPVHAPHIPTPKPGIDFKPIKKL